MAFAVFADGSANLPQTMLEGITLLPCEYTVDGQLGEYQGDVDHFDGHDYYEGLRNGKKVRTTLLNTQLFLDHFTPVLQQGTDVIYIAMSAGIPERFVHIVDSQGCGFGNGLLAVEAAKLSADGVDVREAARILDEDVPHICQYFTVDDLNFLKSTGRVSGFTATIGTVLNIKPILYGDHTGHIVSCSKVRGRRKAVEALAAKYAEKRIVDYDQKVCISHGDCLEDARHLAELVDSITPGVSITICQHEPFSGSHVGPGMLGLFFHGNER